MTDTSGILRGTLNLLVLRCLDEGRQHGYAISEWIDRATDGELLVEEGTLYPALHRLAKSGMIEAEWGLSDSRRRAKFYNLTVRGRKSLSQETERWRRYATAMDKALTGGAG